MVPAWGGSVFQAGFPTLPGPFLLLEVGASVAGLCGQVTRRPHVGLSFLRKEPSAAVPDAGFIWRFEQ